MAGPQGGCGSHPGEVAKIAAQRDFVGRVRIYRVAFTGHLAHTINGPATYLR
jgi:hypothetical protein